MLNVDSAFDRIGSALKKMGYASQRDEKLPNSPDDRLTTFASPKMSVRVRWMGKARMLILEIQVGGEWAEFARRSFGPNGLEETTVEALVKAVAAEVSETSTDGG